MKIDGYGAGRLLVPDGIEAPLWRAREDLRMYLVVDSPNPNRLGLQAAELVATEIESVIETSAAAADGDISSSTRDDLRACAKAALEAANRLLYGAAMARDRDGDVVTASAMLLLLGTDFAVLSHVGNCRLYLYRRGELAQLSREHLRSGATEQGAQTLQRGMGLQAAVELDELVLDLAVGDFLLLVTQAVYRTFNDDREVLANRLAGTGPRDTAHFPAQLLREIDEANGVDETRAVAATCVLLHGYPEPFRARQDVARGDELARCFDALRAIPLFRHLSVEELVQVLDAMQTVKYRAGEAVVSEGIAGQELFVVVDGAVTVERAGKVLAKLSAGSHFGEISLLSARPRSASVRCMTDVTALSIDRARFLSLLRRYPELGMKLLWTLAQVLSRRLHDTNDLLGSAANSVEGVPIAELSLGDIDVEIPPPEEFGR